MKPIVIFGVDECAEVAHFYFQHDTERDVKAFTVDEAYIKEPNWHDRPVVAFESLETTFPPQEYDLFIAIGYSRVNRLRKEKYLAAKQKGYALPGYVSSKATVWSKDIGDNCFLMEDNTIQPYVRIGNNVTLWSGNHIGHHSVIEDHCFLTSQVVVAGMVTVGEGSFLGINATIRNNIQIGKHNVIGAGAYIHKSTQDFAVYPHKGDVPGEIDSFALKHI